jgi:flagellar hook assembly protein FlgD
MDPEPIQLRKIALALVAALLAGAGAFAPAAAPAANAATNPKVAIIVGATHSVTPTYRSYANQIYAEAVKYTTNVVKVYSPNATWSKVKAAVNGASIIVYLGHGNGWPSPYTYDPNYTTKDGFGLNADLNGDGKLSDNENKYYGEPYIDDLTPAPNAVVLLFHLCYASGNSESSSDNPTLSVAKQRVDNYGSAFLKAGARAVIANGHSHDPYYIRALFATKQTIEQYWRGAPDFRNHVLSYASTRRPGYTFLMDPDSAAPSGYYRSIVGKMSLTTEQVTGGSYAGTGGDPSTFVVPGNASPLADGAPVFGSVEDAAALPAAGAVPVTALITADKVRLDAKETALAADGSPIFRMHTDGGTQGWMAGSAIKPRDSAAPRLWTVEDGTGAFSPNGDGSQDAFPLSLRLSESASWTLKVRDDDGAILATANGTGETAALTWSPASGSVPDGTYRWVLTADDEWDNGPSEADGPVVVDTRAPNVSVADADGTTVPQFTPNGDGSRDTIGFAVSSDEPGTVTGAAKDAAGTTTGSFGISVGASGGTLTWDGRTPGGSWAKDGIHTIRIVARDRAGNASAAQTRTVELYGALGFVKTSTSLFFPQDGDALAKTATQSFVLRSAATVTWVMTDAAGTPVRTMKTEAALAAGTYTFAWNVRNDAGAYVPRGLYYVSVTATNGTQTSTQRTSVRADAFRVTFSDTTPARGQKVTITATTAEALSTSLKVRVYQPGLSGYWSATFSKVSATVYKVTITLKSSGTGTATFKVFAQDSNGKPQSTNVLLPLH